MIYFAIGVKMDEKIFNDDILLNHGDVRIVRKVFPEASIMLDWPRLRESFIVHERAANKAKGQSRRRGVLALAVSLLALWLAALEPFFNDVLPGVDLTWLLTGAIGLFGVLGVVFGSGVLVGSRKERWLHHRAATERLRQLHFQFLVRRATQFAAADPAVVAGALAERELVLDLLNRDLTPRVSRPIDAIVEDLGGVICWLFPEQPCIPTTALRSGVLEEVFQAYARLRFQHQIDYATRKLARGLGLWPWEPAGQARRIDAFAYSLTVLVVVCHIVAVVVITLAPAGQSWLSPTLQTVGILAALTALALRVLEDGLRPRTEVGRLRIYRGEIAELFRKFNGLTEPAAKLALMERLEELSYRELRDFLTTHDEANFVL